jgi:glycosyltransferase involved in cell wall biosynthesis
MKIVMVAQIFETLEDNGSDRIFYFAKEFVKKGHHVTIITSNFDYKLGCKRFDNKGNFIRRISGVDVVYVPVYSNIRGSYFRRFAFYISFIISCFAELLRSSKTADVVWAQSTPLTVPFLSAIVARFKKIPLVSEITDVWPDAAVHSGVVKNKVVIGLAKKMELFCYRNSSRIICLTQGIQRNIVDKGIEASKTCLVTNGVDIELFNTSRLSNGSRLKAALGLDKKFVAMYLGAHGTYNSLNTIIHAASILRHESSIVFVFVGDGERKAHVERIAMDERLDNVMFHPPVKRTDAPGILSAADCFLLPNLAGDFFEGNLPNKVFDYLASGRPIIVAGRVESARLVEKIKAGFVVEAEDPNQLAEAVRMVSKLTAVERDRIGSRGSDYVRSHYDRKIHAGYMLSILKSVVVVSD